MQNAGGCYDSNHGLRIGFVEKRDFWDFKLTGAFSVYNDRGEVLLRNIPPTHRWRIQLENWQPAKFKYQILLGRFSDKNEAMEAEYHLIEKGLGVVLKQIGGKHIHNRKTIQNTSEFWLIIDDMKSEDEAFEFARRRLGGMEYKIVRQKISEPHARFNLLNNSYERIGESENLMRIVPDDPETNLFLYHVTRDNQKPGQRERYAKVKGTVEFRCLEGENIGAIAIFSLEEYVENILNLMYIDGMPLEAVKALAVVVRSKTLSRFCVKHSSEPFEICNRSHCFPFEGYREPSAVVTQAMKEVHGEVLFRKKKIIYAEITPVCGGFTESLADSDPVLIEFDYPGIYDTDKKNIPSRYSDLKDESTVRKWIDESEPFFCDLSSHPEPKIVSQFYNDFRWKRFWGVEDLTELVERKINQSLGSIFDIQVTKRSKTGRVQELEILAAHRNVVLKGESEIRSIFGGAEELPGMAFYIESQLDLDGFPESFTFHGAGSGKGYGMCLAGAIGMAERGFSYREILSHYFHGTNLKKIDGVQE